MTTNVKEKERPILFSGPMVRAILERKKSQTRRVVKGEALKWLTPPNEFTPEFVANPENYMCPFGQPGDRLWVRETWCEVPWVHERGGDISTEVLYRADSPGVHFDPATDRWRPSIHMPRWASRLTLEIVAVRVERLQDISEEDARVEGAPCHEGSYRGGFALLWESISGAKPGRSWADNPWAWVVEFKKVEDYDETR